MTIEYLLPCGCGRTTPIKPRQAGETVTCACGATLDVPAMRELQTLDSAVASGPQTGGHWGTRQGLIFLGLLTAAVALPWCCYFYVKMPDTVHYETSRVEIERLDLRNAWEYWMHVQHGMPAEPNGDIADLVDQLNRTRRGLRIALIAAVAGLALAGIGWLTKPRPTGPAA